MMNKTTYYTLGWGSVFAPTGEDYATKAEAIQEAKRLAANGVKDIAVYRITRTSKENEVNMTGRTTTKTDKIIIIAQGEKTMKVIYKNGETVRCDYIINNNGSIEAVQNADAIDETIVPLDLDAVDTIIGRGTVSYADSFGGVELADITLLIVENDMGILEAVEAGGESCEIDVTAFTGDESSERF